MKVRCFCNQWIADAYQSGPGVLDVEIQPRHSTEVIDTFLEADRLGYGYRLSAPSRTINTVTDPRFKPDRRWITAIDDRWVMAIDRKWITALWCTRHQAVWLEADEVHRALRHRRKEFKARSYAPADQDM